MTLKTIIVEDELLARKSLTTLCKKHEALELTAVCENAEQALTHVHNSNIDMILLDIEMPGLSGLDLLDNLPYMPQVIFTTGKKEYAYEAFQYQVTDFLVKPVTQIAFFNAIAKAQEETERIAFAAEKRAAREFYIRIDRNLKRFQYDDVLYIENMGNYVKFVLSDSVHVALTTMKNIEAKLKNHRFVRVHRSFIINMDKVDEIKQNAVIIEDISIPLSKAHRSFLFKRLHIL